MITVRCNEDECEWEGVADGSRGAAILRHGHSEWHLNPFASSYEDGVLLVFSDIELMLDGTNEPPDASNPQQSPNGESQ